MLQTLGYATSKQPLAVAVIVRFADKKKKKKKAHPKLTFRVQNTEEDTHMKAHWVTQRTKTKTKGKTET